MNANTELSKAINTAEQLLSSIKVQDQVEAELKKQIADSEGEVLERIEKVRQEWETFFNEAFPDEVLKLIRDYCHDKIVISKYARYNMHIEINIDDVLFGYNGTGCYFSIHTKKVGCNVYSNINNDKWSVDFKASQIAKQKEMLDKFKEELPEIYQYISEHRQEKVDKQRNSLETIMNTKLEEPKKKYKITIEVEE